MIHESTMWLNWFNLHPRQSVTVLTPVGNTHKPGAGAVGSNPTCFFEHVWSTGHRGQSYKKAACALDLLPWGKALSRFYSVCLLLTSVCILRISIFPEHTGFKKIYIVFWKLRFPTFIQQCIWYLPNSNLFANISKVLYSGVAHCPQNTGAHQLFTATFCRCLG